MSSEIDRTELKANEPLTLKITVTGKGNLELIEALSTVFPARFETYDPKISNILRKTAAAFQAAALSNILLFPEIPVNFRSNPVEFSILILRDSLIPFLQHPGIVLKSTKAMKSRAG